MLEPAPTGPTGPIHFSLLKLPFYCHSALHFSLFNFIAPFLFLFHLQLASPIDDFVHDFSELLRLLHPLLPCTTPEPIYIPQLVQGRSKILFSKRPALT